MNAVFVFKNSVSACVAKEAGCMEMSKLNRKAWNATVFISLFDDKIRIQSNCTRTKRVPAKAIKDSLSFINWIESIIENAWKEK